MAWIISFFTSNHNLLKNAKGTTKYTGNIQEIHLEEEKRLKKKKHESYKNLNQGKCPMVKSL